MYRPTQRLCSSCSHQIVTLFTNGFASPRNISRCGSKSFVSNTSRNHFDTLLRPFTTRGSHRATVEHDELQDDGPIRSAAQMEAIVRQARQTFGETLPENFLSEDEYRIYERLYGPPSATTLPEDVDLLSGSVAEEVQVDDGPVENVLMREDKDGNLEEIVFEEEPEDSIEEGEEQLEEAETQFSDEDIIAELERLGKQTGEMQEDAVASIDPEADDAFQTRMQEDTVASIDPEAHEEFQTRMQEGAVASIDPEVHEAFKMRMKSLREKFAAGRITSDAVETKEDTAIVEEEAEEPEESLHVEEEEVDRDFEDEGAEHDGSDIVRTHPLTAAGEFGTYPSTIQLTKDSMVDPITALLADASNKHLTEVAQRAFGGSGLPNSTATITRPNLVQQNIALEASQSRMGEMESNTYLAAIYPGAYASIMSILVEVRKRLGSSWLRNLMNKHDGPRILDAGAGGAGVLAWREVIQAEYEAMRPSTPSKTKRPPFGKSTVVTGSPALRLRASALLDDTTFIPRLPDYDPSRDHPSLESSNPQARKQYDIIIAPYTLWSLKEDHMRKSQLQNFWSLLKPRGGVLILLEKGVPRGFELIAGARETLLKHHISSPGSEEVENAIESANPNRFTAKEKGMIIAPCTNHGKCPMYITAGKSQGRKDFCRFNQRFIRPPYLQRILGEKEKNHEDISFSYVAFQRGRDLRKEQNVQQGQPAADAAFEGYEEHDVEDGKRSPSALSMPRAILPPIKRRGHVILDLCTPAGKIERWTVPRSFSKQAYRDARKSKWGDLWALGAKTRVERNIRVGVKVKKDKTMQVDMSDQMAGLEDEQALAADAVPKKGTKGKASARDRKGRSGRTKYYNKMTITADGDGL